MLLGTTAASSPDLRAFFHILERKPFRMQKIAGKAGDEARTVHSLQLFNPWYKDQVQEIEAAITSKWEHEWTEIWLEHSWSDQECGPTTSNWSIWTKGGGVVNYIYMYHTHTFWKASAVCTSQLNKPINHYNGEFICHFWHYRCFTKNRKHRDPIQFLSLKVFGCDSQI